MVRLLCSLVAVAVLFAASVSAQVAPVRTPTKAAPTLTSPINLNSATQAELETLPGIGAKTAARIIDYRQKKGPFKKVEEILENSSSCPSLLSNLDFSVHRSVSGSR